jgi:hypothetical protein
MKTSAIMKRIRFLTSIMISCLILSPISVLAWRNYIEEYSSHDFGEGAGIGYIRGSILLTGWNNISHDMTLRIQTTANGKVDAVRLIEVNLTLYRNSVEIQEFNADNIHSITYLTQFKLSIYYNNNISIIGTVEAEFNVDGTIQTYVFPVQVTYIAPHAEWYETYALALIITIITLIGLTIVALLIYRRKQAKISA